MEALDRPRLEELYRRLERPLFNTVFRWLWNRHDASEVVQETFVRLWGMRERVDLDRVTPLAYRIAVNLAANHRRHRRLWGWISLETLDERAAPADNPGASVETREREDAVRQAVEALPERLRRVVMLCEVGGLSYAEVAATLGIPEGTVASRRNHALRRLREALGEEEP